MRNLVFISTHILNKAVISEYKKMTKNNDIDCILVVDDSNLHLGVNGGVEEIEFLGTRIKCIFFNQDFSNKLNLPNGYEFGEAENFMQVMWHNSDYRFYYAKNILPDYDFYWQIEYDVFCNGDSYSSFFEKYSQSNEDLLICDLREETINGEWYWANGIDWAYKDKIYGSFFPICRLSSKAINFLYNKRIELFKQYKNLNKNEADYRWLFGELFVPTELINNGFSAKSIDEKYVSHDFWNKEFDLNEDRIFENPDNLLYHPVKGQMVNRIEKLKKENEDLKQKIQNLEAKSNKKLLRKIFLHS